MITFAGCAGVLRISDCRSRVLKAIALGATLVLLTVSARAQQVTRAPYLQVSTPTSVVVKWRTNVPTPSVVRYGSPPGGLTQAATVNASVTNHEVRVAGLLPDTKYYYSVGTPTQELRGNNLNHFFVTAPSPGVSKPTRIWVVGDSGTATGEARAVRNSYMHLAGDRAADLWLMLGDNAYPDGTDADYQNAVFNMYPELLKNTVLWSTLGNHDGQSADSVSQSGPYYDIFSLPRSGEAGGVPSGTEAYYSFDYGDIHFVCLDSYGTDRSPGGAMIQWLRADLQANDKIWVIAFWHHPPYSKGTHDSDNPSGEDGELVDMRENALPLLEEYGVDLVLAGHSHSYERSYLIDRHYGFSGTFNQSMMVDTGDGGESGDGAYQKPVAVKAPHEGAVYAVAGASGQTGGFQSNLHPAMVVNWDELGSLVLDVDNNRLHARYVEGDGKISDDFTILKGTDTAPPTISSAVLELSSNRVVVTFSERVQESGATDASNYSLGAGSSVISASLADDGKTVTLLTTTPGAQVASAVTIQGVADLAGNGIAPLSRAQLHYRELFQNGVAPDAGYAGTADATISENEPSSNFGSVNTLLADGNDNGGDLASLLRWDISRIPTGAVVSSARITFDVFNDSAYTSYELYELKRQWVESEVNWNRSADGGSWAVAGARGTSDRGTEALGFMAPGVRQAEDAILNPAMLALVQRWVSDPSSNYGVILTSASSSDGMDFRSSEADDLTSRPRLSVTYSMPEQSRPTIGAVINGASSDPLISPGSIVSVFGDFVGTTALASAVPLPTNLSGLSVMFNGVPGALIGVFDGPFDQSNVQVPWEVDASSGRIEVTVRRDGGAESDTFGVDADVASPEIYRYPLGTTQAIVANFKQNGDDVTSGSWAQMPGTIDPIVGQPAAIGGIATIWCNGLGPVTPKPATGDIPPSGVVPLTDKIVRVLVGGVQAQILGSAVLQPTFVGLNQINIVIPAGVTPGASVPIVIEVDSGDGRILRSRSDATIAVRIAP